MESPRRKREKFYVLSAALISISAVVGGFALLTARVSVAGAASLGDGREIKISTNLGLMDDGVGISSYKINKYRREVKRIYAMLKKSGELRM